MTTYVIFNTFLTLYIAVGVWLKKQMVEGKIIFVRSKWRGVNASRREYPLSKKDISAVALFWPLVAFWIVGIMFKKS